jgi:lipopolysaccharide transport system permease protein
MLSQRSLTISALWQSVVYQTDLLRTLVDRDMKLLYKRSVLGVAWTLISPLLQLVVFAFVFQVILPTHVPQYASFVFTGLLVWNWFQNSLFQATGTIFVNRPLIRQPGFPSSILPVVTVATGLVHFILALPVLVIFLLMDGVRLQPIILLLPALQGLQFMFTVSLAYILAALNVTFRDTQHTLGVILQLFFYLTPIFYDSQQVPSQYQGIYGLNPMVQFVAAYRSILLGRHELLWFPLLLIAGMTVGLLPIGYYLFRQQSDRFVEEL